MSKQKNPGAAEAPASYLVREPLRRDGVDYAVGAEIVLDAAAAAPLLDSGAIAAPSVDLTVSAD